MTKITRAVQKIFASNSGFQEVAQFGSLANSTPTYTLNPVTIQALSQFLSGWFSAIQGGSYPAENDQNALDYLWSYQLAYLLQQGVPEYDASTTYYSGSLVNNSAWIFTVSSANATVGATYTNNGFTYTIQDTISSGTKLVATGSGAPLTSGTLTKASGTGDATITFSAYVVSAGVYLSIVDANVGNAITNTTNWLPPGTNATTVGISNVTIPVGYTYQDAFLTINSGVTYTIAGTAVILGNSVINGILIATGTVVFL